MSDEAIARAPDQRIVYGAHCTWWDSIQRVGRRGNLPCCPHCGSPLFEMPSEAQFIDGARAYEASGHPAYVSKLTWARGKCFPGFAALEAEYLRATA